MNKQQESIGGYWYTFAVGAALGAGAMFFLGTKQGRKLLHKMTDSFEDIEKVAEEYIDTLSQELSQK